MVSRRLWFMAADRGGTAPPVADGAGGGASADRRVGLTHKDRYPEGRVAGSSNGKTPASGAGYRGSSPCPAVPSLPLSRLDGLDHMYKVHRKGLTPGPPLLRVAMSPIPVLSGRDRGKITVGVALTRQAEAAGAGWLLNTGASATHIVATHTRSMHVQPLSLRSTAPSKLVPLGIGSDAARPSS